MDGEAAPDVRPRPPQVVDQFAAATSFLQRVSQGGEAVRVEAASLFFGEVVLGRGTGQAQDLGCQPTRGQGNGAVGQAGQRDGRVPPCEPADVADRLDGDVVSGAAGLRRQVCSDRCLSILRVPGKGNATQVGADLEAFLADTQLGVAPVN